MSDTVYRDKAKEVIAGELFNKLGISQSLAIEVASVIDILPSANNWIPCSERLPSNNREVLISCEWGIDIGQYEKDGWRSEWINHYDDDNVLAWQPLPQPYMKGGTE